MILVTVIDASGKSSTYELDASPSILTAFEDAGYQYPHGCRVGVCGSCISEVLAGIEHLPPPDFVEKRRLEELRKEERRNSSQLLDGKHIRFCCRTALTIGPITLKPISGSVRRSSD